MFILDSRINAEYSKENTVGWILWREHRHVLSMLYTIYVKINVVSERIILQVESPKAWTPNTAIDPSVLRRSPSICFEN